MRLPLPGRDYFPARVLLRGVPPIFLRDEPEPAPMVQGPACLAWGPTAWPAAPPMPAFALRPAG